MMVRAGPNRDESDAMTDAEPEGVPVLRLSEAALAKVLELRAGEPDPDTLALVVEINGTSGQSYTYDLYFQPTTDARPKDWVGERGGLTLLVPASSLDRLRGALLDLSRDDQGGMVIQNPNQPEPPAASPTMGGPPPNLEGDVAQRLLAVLDEQINPSIAAHGGRADLVSVEEDTAYLRLSGGCAGCGLATVTLSQGIEVAIFAAVPEITRVVDVTDHAAGTNPFYEPAKK
jgi:Fe/S biogenesis protein NfuA